MSQTPEVINAADQVEHDLEALDVSTRALLTLLRAQDTQPPTGGGGGEGFPVLASYTSNDGDNTGDTSHEVTLPGSLASGDLLVIVARELSFDGPTGISAGWTLVDDRQTPNTTSVWSRVSDGTETTVTITTATNTRIAWIAMRFTNAASIEGVIATEDTVDPPEYTTTYGSAEVLWMTVCTDRQSNFTFTAPSGYSTAIDVGAPSSGFTSRFRVGVAFREVEAATENPGVWTRSGTASRPHAGTFAIRA